MCLDDLSLSIDNILLLHEEMDATAQIDGLSPIEPNNYFSLYKKYLSHHWNDDGQTTNSTLSYKRRNLGKRK